MADFETARADFIPLSLRDIKLEKSEVSWADIGGEACPCRCERPVINFFSQGLHETRRILRETLEWPTKYGPIFAQSPLRLRSGFALRSLRSRTKLILGTGFFCLGILDAARLSLLQQLRKNAV